MQNDAERALCTRLRAGEHLRLLFVKMPAPAEVELAGLTGFDAVILDTEHGTDQHLEEHLRAADAVGLPALVRVPGPDPAPILRALDAGATGIVVAHVTDAGSAEQAVAAAHYPPRGRRGLALTTRAGRHGTARLSDHLQRAAEQTLVFVQIEDGEAVAQTDAICLVDGVDAVLIGATDLSISLGHPGELDHPDLTRANGTITEQAQARHVPVATVVSSCLEAESAESQVVVFVATLLVRDAFRAAAAPRNYGTAAREPIVLLPGMLETAELWDGVAPVLRELTSVLFGRIDLDSSVEEMAESVLASAPGRFSLVGHSLGALVALAIIRRAPQRVAGLALLNANAQPPTQSQLDDWQEMADQAREGFAELAARFARGNLPQQRQQDADLVALVEAMVNRCGSPALQRQIAAQRSRGDARPALAAVKAPTLVIAGADDTVCPPDRQAELAAAIPGARLERLEGVGHLAPLEAPGEVARLLSEWLHAQGPSPASIGPVDGAWPVQGSALNW
jgi:4-hydroxy-2-oxoheptanedioate aldolase